MKKVLVMVIMCILISGCNNKLVKIEKGLFTDLDSIDIVIDNSDIGYQMSDKQIDILKKSIDECISIEELTRKDYKEELYNSNVVIIIKKTNSKEANLRFNVDSGYLFIRKIDIFLGDPKKIMMNRALSKKYIEGAYRIRPSNRFQQLLNPLMKH